jgi:hypothetical protein
MYDEPRIVPVPYVRRPLGIGPGLCELLGTVKAKFAEFPFYEVG